MNEEGGRERGREGGREGGGRNVPCLSSASRHFLSSLKDLSLERPRGSKPSGKGEVLPASSSISARFMLRREGEGEERGGETVSLGAGGVPEGSFVPEGTGGDG